MKNLKRYGLLLGLFFLTGVAQAGFVDSVKAWWGKRKEPVLTQEQLNELRRGYYRDAATHAAVYQESRAAALASETEARKAGMSLGGDAMEELVKGPLQSQAAREHAMNAVRARNDLILSLGAASDRAKEQIRLAGRDTRAALAQAAKRMSPRSTQAAHTTIDAHLGHLNAALTEHEQLARDMVPYRSDPANRRPVEITGGYSDKELLRVTGAHRALLEARDGLAAAKGKIPKPKATRRVMPMPHA